MTTETTHGQTSRTLRRSGTPQRREVVVIGAGAIGLSAGYHAALDDRQVTVLDAGAFGAGASWGNAGWIVPSLVHPFNAPKAVPQAMLAMLDPRSPIALRRVPTPRLAQWGWQFFRASSAARSEESLRTLARLALTATADMQRLAGDLGFELHRDGLLVTFRSKEAMRVYAEGHKHVEELGYTGRVQQLDAAGVRAAEPSLGPDVVGGLHFLDELSVRPNTFTKALATAIEGRGGETSAFESVRGIWRSTNGDQWIVETSKRILAADVVVVAAGERSAGLLRPLGVRIPLEAGRGVSVLLEPEQLALRQPLKIAEHRVACTPFENGQVRISGTFDLTRIGAGPAVGRMRSVLAKAQTHLPGLADVDINPSNVWAGARPCTPDSVPIVNEIPQHRGLIVATGHGTLGVTLAPETGRRVASLIRTSLKATQQGAAPL